MTFSYSAMTEEEINKARYNLLPDGDYDAIVETSNPKISASNNSMAEMKLTVLDQSGKGHPVRDFLIFIPSMMWKPFHFCQSAGLEKEFNENKFHPKMAEKRTVRVRIRNEKGTEIPEDKLNGKPKGSKYPDKNIVLDYLPKGETAKTDNFFNDKLPF